MSIDQSSYILVASNGQDALILQQVETWLGLLVEIDMHDVLKNYGKKATSRQSLHTPMLSPTMNVLPAIHLS
jgi:hypothetical protein